LLISAAVQIPIAQRFLKPPGVILNKFEYIKLEEEQERDTCIIVGYQEIHNYQTGANGPANKKTNGLYEYEMDTGKGQSGGPLLLSGTVQPIAIGVHIHGLIEKIKLRHTHYSKFYKMGMG